MLFLFITSQALAQVPNKVICPEHQYKSAYICENKCVDGAKWDSKSKQCVCDSSAFLLARKSGLFSSKHQRVCLKKCINGAFWDRKSRSCLCQSESFELIKNKRGQEFCADRCRLKAYTHWDNDKKICTCPKGTEESSLELDLLKKKFVEMSLSYTPSLSFEGKLNRKVEESVPCYAIKCYGGRWSKQKKKCLRCPSGTKKVSYFCISREDIGSKIWNKDHSTFQCSKGSMYCKSLYICLDKEVYSYYTCDQSHPF